jgi:hypothetical protein
MYYLLDILCDIANGGNAKGYESDGKATIEKDYTATFHDVSPLWG